MDEKQIERIGSYLNATKKVIVCGKGSSGLWQEKWKSVLCVSRVDVDSITDTDLMRMQAVFQNENSLIWIQNGGQKEEVIFLLKRESEGRKLFYLLRIIETIIKNSVQKSWLIPLVRHLRSWECNLALVSDSYHD